MTVNLKLGHTGLILDVCRRSGVLRNQAAYLLATAFWETGRSMEPIKETVQANHKYRNPSDAEVMQRLDRAWHKGQLPWVSGPYWRAGYFGRGFVQLTHFENYEKAGKALGLNLTGFPEKALDPDNAARILVTGCMDGWFTGKKISDYVTLYKSDFAGARRVVNGTDKAQEIAQLARDYDAALKAAGYGEEAPARPVAPVTPAAKPSRLAPLWAALDALLARLNRR